MQLLIEPKNTHPLADFLLETRDVMHHVWDIKDLFMMSMVDKTMGDVAAKFFQFINKNPAPQIPDVHSVRMAYYALHRQRVFKQIQILLSEYENMMDLKMSYLSKYSGYTDPKEAMIEEIKMVLSPDRPITRNQLIQYFREKMHEWERHLRGNHNNSSFMTFLTNIVKILVCNISIDLEGYSSTDKPSLPTANRSSLLQDATRLIFPGMEPSISSCHSRYDSKPLTKKLPIDADKNAPTPVGHNFFTAYMKEKNPVILQHSEVKNKASSSVSASGQGMFSANKPPKTIEIPELPEAFCCPISGELMNEPVRVKGFIKDKRHYERATIQAWLEKKKSSPFTFETPENLPMDKLFIPDQALKSEIDAYRNSQSVGIATVSQS